ncbi:SDR family oxidoreductase [Sphingobium ummariense]|uniref:NAD-dependent epimerase/dehydratase domain-containing protein n=1 Tax=Sphingobium ummariense RL-3 TaxID=1346791 RepID=T0J0P8_9SPHN|nr:SDR family oxidoreductase [Sphingobium ummariense]EQB31536.1 hypothetical protein M529_14560 [Sphingobium ummariense RL-3]
MQIFVTGATGFVGSAVVEELVGAGHGVTGLARSDASAQALAAMGAAVRRGTLDDLDALRDGAAAADAVIHLAFNHDFSRFADNVAQDRRAIEVLGSALQGSARPLLATSGLALARQGDVATEADRTSPDFPRQSETAAFDLAARGVRASVVRLAPSTHGKGDHGFVPHLIGLAREKGIAAHVGDGFNRWPGVHRRDAARLFRLAIERGAQGEAWHAVDDEGVPFKAIAEIIGRRLGVPTVSLAPEEAEAHFGWFTFFAGMDIPASSAQTRAVLGWTPEHPGLLEDLDQDHYFAG